MPKYIKPEKEPGKIAVKQTSSEYVDPMGLTEKNLGPGVWYITHLAQLKKGLKIFLISVSLLAWGYFFYGFLSYIFIGMKQDQKLVDDIVRSTPVNHEYSVSVRPKNLIIGDVQALNNSTEKTYDLVTQIENPNLRHWAEIEFSYIANGKELPTVKSLIFPSEKKYLTVISAEFPAFPADAALRIKKLTWHPIKTKEISDWPKFYSEHMNIEIQNPKFDMGSISQISEKIKMTKVTFTAVNNTAYNYWEVKFLVLLMQGDRIASLSSFTQDNLQSGKSADISLSWPSSVTSATGLQVIPEINIMDKNVYMEFQGEPNSSQPGKNGANTNRNRNDENDLEIY